jgi:hypothetical protein
MVVAHRAAVFFTANMGGPSSVPEPTRRSYGRERDRCEARGMYASGMGLARVDTTPPILTTSVTACRRRQRPLSLPAPSRGGGILPTRDRAQRSLSRGSGRARRTDLTLPPRIGGQVTSSDGVPSAEMEP